MYDCASYHIYPRWWSTYKGGWGVGGGNGGGRGMAILLVADWGLFPDKGALNGGHFNKLHERSIKQ